MSQSFRPNKLKGAQTSATYSIANGACSPVNIDGPAVTDCVYDTNEPSFVVAYIECPDGQIALQNGCVSTGAEAITGVTQQLTDVQTVQCITNLPLGQDYVVTVTATCVELAITAPGNTVLKSKQTAQATRGQIAAAAAKLRGV